MIIQNEIDRFRELWKNASKHNVTLTRFPHGGGRLFVQHSNHKELIADFYDTNNREFYYSTLTIVPLLLDELDRLKRGDFTEEEFQNLCHNLPSNCTREKFEVGCREYQQKLFGKPIKMD